MTAHRDLDRQLNDFLRDGPAELPYQSFDAVRDRIEQTGQRVVIGPWRLPEMNKIVTVGLGAVAVIAMLLVGAQLFGGSDGSNVGVEPTASPTVEPTATPEPSPTAAPSLTESFTSSRHGVSLSYPEGWTAQAATAPWTGAQPNFGDPPADFLYNPALTDHLFLSIASQPIGDATPDEWVAQELTLYECTASEPTAVDGATGLIGADDCNVAAVTTEGRGYVFALYTSGDEAWLGPTFDRAWFEEVLATVQLQPEDAVD